MLDFIANHEPTVRLSFFLGTLGAVGIWQAFAPKRPPSVSILWRWLNNFGVTFLNTLLLRLLFPILAVGLAVTATENGWGLLNVVELPIAFSIVIAVILQDLVIYWQHVIFHRVGFLWKFHKMHHADVDYDVSTGARFHPVEILLSMVLKLVVVLLIGPPVVAVIIFEILLSSIAMFNHANAGLPEKIDNFARKFIVTPDMHRVHHSVIRDEHNSNYGFNLPWWDYMFSTYRPQPSAGHDKMTIGLNEYQSHRKQSIFWMLRLPFAKR
ncbi:sterol desaturase family protein [Sneathiella sp. CAU 1612]|uniref:Sterol desaturase family protein n=1 Tax=Sneathiella sedimenti TaxID=2816034 RepID=A0ABS3F0M1_9PROT|nr:sterol desaturase family protein [Sneathiella sedimenti]MBO0332055.1 sterol desaturase family protein [Sneathiella sedimenti]